MRGLKPGEGAVVNLNGTQMTESGLELRVSLGQGNFSNFD